PEDAGADAGAQGLGTGFLGAKALGVRGGARGAPVRFLPFDGGEDALDEAVTILFQNLLDATDIDKIAAQADDHARASFMILRISLIESSSPPKIASPMIK